MELHFAPETFGSDTHHELLLAAADRHRLVKFAKAARAAQRRAAAGAAAPAPAGPAKPARNRRWAM